MALMITFIITLVCADVNFQKTEGVRDIVTDQHTSQSYLFDGETYRLIPDNHTIERFAQFSQILEPSVLRLEGRLGKPLDSLVPNDGTPDEIMRVQLALIKSLYKHRIVTSTFHIGHYFNPAICVFQRMLFMSFRGNLWADDRAYFTWLNASFMPIHPQTHAFGITGEGTYLDERLRGAEDMRLVPLTDGEMLLSYSQIIGKTGNDYHVKMKVANLRIGPNGKAEISPPYFLKIDEQSHRSHKNWTPFLYGSSVYFIVDIHPLKVVSLPQAYSPIINVPIQEESTPSGSNETLDSNTTSGGVAVDVVANNETVTAPTAAVAADIDHSPPAQETILCTLVSLTTCPNLKWDFGVIRGGTPAVFIPELGEFISFFHSKHILEGSKFATYFIGAFSFSAAAPFTLQRFSEAPIMMDEWYTGEWCNEGKQDYIVFPMGLVLMKENGTTVIMMSMGHNDREGWIVKIRLPDLMQNMKPLTCDQK